MSRRLSETQKRLWAQASELLGKIDPRAPVAELPVFSTEAADTPTDTGVGDFYAPEASVSVGDVVKNPHSRRSGGGSASLDVPADRSGGGSASLDIPAGRSGDGSASLDVPAARSGDGSASLDTPDGKSDDKSESLDVPVLNSEVGVASLDATETPKDSGDAVSQIPDSLAAYITLAAEPSEAKGDALAKQQKTAPAETLPVAGTEGAHLPGTEATPTAEPAAAAEPVRVLPKAERIDAARAAFTLDAVADEYAVSFFRRIAWAGDGTTAPQILSAPAQAPALELSIVGSRTFFSTCIPWAGRGQLPAATSESAGGAAPLRSLLAAATESALHAARKMARGPGARSKAREGSAASFFQNLAWQRQQTEIAA